MRLPPRVRPAIIGAFLLAAAPAAAQTASSAVSTNDNRRAAGTLSDRVLTLALYADAGRVTRPCTSRPRSRPFRTRTAIVVPSGTLTSGPGIWSGPPWMPTAATVSAGPDSRAGHHAPASA